MIDRLSSEQFHKLGDARQDRRRRYAPLAGQHDNARRGVGWKAKRVAEILIENHEHAAFLPAYRVNGRVVRAAQSLVGDRSDIMALRLQQRFSDWRAVDLQSV
jgi:hypothetical protein